MFPVVDPRFQIEAASPCLKLVIQDFKHVQLTGVSIQRKGSTVPAPKREGWGGGNLTLVICFPEQLESGKKNPKNVPPGYSQYWRLKILPVHKYVACIFVVLSESRNKFLFEMNRLYRRKNWRIRHGGEWSFCWLERKFREFREFKNSVCFLCHAGVVVTFWSLKQEVPGVIIPSIEYIIPTASKGWEGGNSFSLLICPHRGGGGTTAWSRGGYPSLVQMGGVPRPGPHGEWGYPNQVQLGVPWLGPAEGGTQYGVPPSQGWGTHQDRTADRLLDKRWSVCLLCSRRRTFLSLNLVKTFQENSNILHIYQTRMLLSWRHTFCVQPRSQNIYNRQKIYFLSFDLNFLWYSPWLFNDLNL